MTRHLSFSYNFRSLGISACAGALILFTACKQSEAVDLRIKQMDSTEAAAIAASIESAVKPEVAEGLTLKLWGIDSLVVSPISLDVDDRGRVFYSTTNRQKHSEFDIRGHRDWEIPSISLQTVEDRRAFLRQELSPENSGRNQWLADLNGDSSHDWKDLTVERENIYRLEDRSGDGVADLSQLVVDDFHDEVTDVVGGVLSEGDDLYVAVAPDLWRMKDKNNDGIVDEKTSLSHGYGVHIGFGGHGMSGIVMGPDGRLYWQIGDIGFNGKGSKGEQHEHPNSGVIVRSNPDGSDFEVFAHGLRNTHEFVFDEYGNIISEDNDGDHAGEKERLVYIVNGSDAGWRSNWQYGKYNDPSNNSYKVWMEEKLYLPRFEGQAAHITPCISNFVSGPSGMAYNPGTALGPEFKNTFFVTEFVGNPSGSGIHAFKLKPKGASFELGDHKKILSGVLATGLDFGPDGALYIADWIDGWDTHDYGRIWKLDDTKASTSAMRAMVKALLASDFSGKTPNELFALLFNEDMRVRMKAQFALVKRTDKGGAVFQQALNQKQSQLARIHAIWGISQLARQDTKHAAPLLPLLHDSDAEVRAQAARWLGDIRYKGAAQQLITALKDSSSRVRFFAAEALGRIEHEPAVQPLLDFLAHNNDSDAYLRHAGSLALARIGKSEPLIALASHPLRALRIAAIVALRRMSDPGVAKFLNDKDEFIVTEAARAINDDLSIQKALPALARLLSTTHFKNEALLRRSINANLRVGTDEALQTLIKYAIRRDAPTAMRAEATDVIGVWTKPSVLDRVDGRLRGKVERDSGPVVAHSASALRQLLKDNAVSVKVSAAKASSRLKINGASADLLAVIRTDRQAEVRVAALDALVALNTQDLERGIRAALSDKDKVVRVAGLDLLEKTALPKDVMVSLLKDVIATKTTAEKQAAIVTLGKLPPANSQQLLAELLDGMASGKLSRDVYLELGEAIDSSRVPDLLARYKEVSAKLSPDEVIAAYSSSLTGGDAQRGRHIFFQNQNAQCMRCHSYDDKGGNAGPRLNGVAGRLSREQLLEALIAPGKRLAPGYGMITLELKDTTKITGTYMGEDASAVRIKDGESGERRIPKKEVSRSEMAPSSMPDMKVLLSKKEIRDVVSFLATLKENN